MIPIKTKKWKTLTIVIVVFTLFILLIEIFPRTIALVETLIEWNARVALVSNSENTATDLQRVEFENNRLKRGIERIVTDYEENKKISSIISLLNEIAGKTGPTISVIRPQEIRKSGNLWLQPIELRLSSDYDEFFNFVKMLEAAKKVMQINQIEIKPKKILKSGININMNLSVYLNI